MGSDTGGSVRIPAAMCGTVGLKPTYGLVSRRGVIPNSFSFDHCGPLTWTVEDCAIVLNVIAGHDSRDPASARRPVPDYRAALTGDVRGLRIGVVRHGASVETVRMRPCQSYTDIKVVIAGTEIFAVHQRDLIARARDFGANFLVQTLAGCLFQSVDYVQAQRERCIVLQEMEGIYANYDVLVTTSSSPAPRLDHYSTLNAWVKPNVQAVFSVTGGPAIAICNGYTASGLPLSMQIAGRPFDEGTVLRMADAYEKATPWRKRRPQLVPGAPRPQISVPTALGKVEIDAQTRELAKVLAQRAGLTVDASMLESLCELAPYAFAMGSRIRRDHSWSEEPANVFTFPHY